MMQGRHPGLVDLLNCLDLSVRHNCQPIPLFAEQLHQPWCLSHLDVTSLVHDMLDEHVPRKHWNGGAIPGSITPRPCIDSGQEQLKSLCGKLVMYLLLAVASHPKDVPLFLARRLGG
jgi:hypothetical protein